MKPIITFGIPLAPKCRINYWEKSQDNLNRTLNSLENQSSNNYNVVLVRTDHDKIRLDKEYRNLFILDNPDLEEFSIDKDNKTRAAMYMHWELKAKFFQRLDSDDLIHKNLVKFVEDNDNKYGWLIQYGYFYKPDINVIISFDNFWQHCGSSSIINYTENECKNGPEHEFHHQKIPANRMKIEKPLSIIPFRAGAYVIHGNNVSTSKHEKIFKNSNWDLISNEFKEMFI